MATFEDVNEIHILDVDKSNKTISISGLGRCHLKQEDDKRILMCEPEDKTEN